MSPSAERQSEAGDGKRMPTMRRADDGGNDDQAAASYPRLPRNAFARRVLRDMQAERANAKPCRLRPSIAINGRPRRGLSGFLPMWLRVALARSDSIEWGIVHYPRPVPVDTARTTAPLRQATLDWPGTDETCPKCHGRRHVMSITYMRANPVSRWSAASACDLPGLCRQGKCADAPLHDDRSRLRSYRQGVE
jgi:hypothetical protein